MASDVLSVGDYEEIFEGLALPMAICEADGRVRHANAAARHLLGITPTSPVRLALDERETLSAFRTSRRRGTSLEFFLADVAVQGAALERVSLSVSPLEWGGFRVTFGEERAAQRTPTARLFAALSDVSGHIALFDDMAELLALFGSCLREVFSEASYHMEIWRRDEELLAALSHGPGEWTREAMARAATTEGEVSGRALEEEELGWEVSRRGHVAWGEPNARLRCGVQIEWRVGRGVSQAEQEAVELFTHVLGFYLARLRQLRPMAAEGSRARSLEETLWVPVLEQLDAALALCDGRRALRSCTESFARAFSREVEGLLGADILTLFEGEVAAQVRQGAAAALSGATPEPLVVRVPGYEREVELRVVPLEEGDALRGRVSDAGMGRGFLLLLQSERRSLSEAARQMEQAEHLLQVGQLASGVAHELKNPLTSILNYADYLLHKYRDQLFEKRDSERLVRIIEGVERIDQFVRDLVLLARPGSSQEPLVEVNLHEVLTRACYLCEITLEQHGARVVRRLEASDPRVEGVSAMLVQVFVNLLSNAAAALPESGGDIALVTWQDEHMLWCEVRDQGCGMDAETLSRIFEPFYTRRRHTGGSGLGLPLVRSLIERHGGKVEIESEPERGTVVTLCLPRAFSEARTQERSG